MALPGQIQPRVATLGFEGGRELVNRVSRAQRRGPHEACEASADVRHGVRAPGRWVETRLQPCVAVGASVTDRATTRDHKEAEAAGLTGMKKDRPDLGDQSAEILMLLQTKRPTYCFEEMNI